MLIVVIYGIPFLNAIRTSYYTDEHAILPACIVQVNNPATRT